MPLSFDTLRIGKKYHLHNYGEASAFEIIERLPNEDFKLKDLTSMDIYKLSDLVKYGKSSDFDLQEIEAE